jgi:hypothetical protein
MNINSTAILNGTSTTSLGSIIITRMVKALYIAFMAKTNIGLRLLIGSIRIMIISVASVFHFLLLRHILIVSYSQCLLVGADIEHSHPEASGDLIKWGKWVIDEIGACGFRFDAVKVLAFPPFLHIIRLFNLSHAC